MTEITSLATANPDPSQIAQNISGAFDQAYTALQQAWESMQAGQTAQAESAMVVVDQQLQVMQEQVAVQAALIAGQQEVIETQDAQIEELIGSMEDVKNDAYQEGYSDAYDEGVGEPDPYWLEEVITEEVYERERQFEEGAGFAADKLRTVGEHDLAAEIEEKVKQAVALKEEAERLIDRGHNVAWQKRQNQLPLVIDQPEDSSDE